MREIVVAGFQMPGSNDVHANESRIKSAIAKAKSGGAEWLLTPEGSLSGYTPDFDRRAVQEAANRLSTFARDQGVGLLLGTCFKEIGNANGWAETSKDQGQEYCYDQIRAYSPSGLYLGAHSKILLCSSPRYPGSGEMRSYIAGTLNTYSWGGACIGLLICNDLWATPGFTTLPNPYLAQQLRSMGAQVIFHAASTAASSRWREYQESNQSHWAETLNIPIVTVNTTEGAISARSGIYDCKGTRVIEAPIEGEQLFIAKITIGSSLHEA